MQQEPNNPELPPPAPQPPPAPAAAPSLEEISQYFRLPFAEAAAKLGLCQTSFKKLCRRRGIERWPFRKLSTMDKQMAKLSEAAGTDLPVLALTDPEADEKPTQLRKRADLTLEDIQKCFRFTFGVAARKLGLCETSLKKRCRKLGISRWPHRKLAEIDRGLKSLDSNLKFVGETEHDRKLDVLGFDPETSKVLNQVVPEHEEAEQPPAQPSNRGQVAHGPAYGCQLAPAYTLPPSRVDMVMPPEMLHYPQQTPIFGSSPHWSAGWPPRPLLTTGPLRSPFASGMAHPSMMAASMDPTTWGKSLREWPAPPTPLVPSELRPSLPYAPQYLPMQYATDWWHDLDSRR